MKKKQVIKFDIVELLHQGEFSAADLMEILDFVKLKVKPVKSHGLLHPSEWKGNSDSMFNDR